TASIGYAMFNLAGGAYPSEGFLVAFEIIDIALVAALAAAVMLAKTEEGGRIAGALRFNATNLREGETRADGGQEER
ncbi:MAG TPA: NADH-quinone oxidoreductase subunit J, partial [Halococcus sp.]|nr:NADH-quinone oxidoreductase subunit J [Halococcus sp.]